MLDDVVHSDTAQRLFEFLLGIREKRKHDFDDELRVRLLSGFVDVAGAQIGTVTHALGSAYRAPAVQSFVHGYRLAMMVAAGAGWLIFLSPLVIYLSTYLKILGLFAEASLMLWLIVKGVNVQRWNDVAAARRGRLA